MTLTEEQLRLARHRAGRAACFAVPGAGKTATLTERTRMLLEEGVPRERILVCTFAKANVEDFARRLGQESEGVMVMTIHRLGCLVLRLAHELFVPGTGPLKVARAESLLERSDEAFLAYLGLEKSAMRVPDANSEERRAGLRLPRAPVGFAERYAFFEAKRRALGVVTFDDMALDACRLLLRSEALRNRVQGRFRHVMADEFQDVCPSQAALLELVAERSESFLAIGDDDQAVYGWRGAEPTILRAFAEKSAAVYRLSENFRSRGEILSVAGNLIAHGKERDGKRLSLTRGYGGTLELLRLSPLETASQLAADILRDVEAGSSFAEMAVLIRKHSQSPLIEASLLKAGIPYRHLGMAPVYARRGSLRIIQQLQGAYYLRHPPEGKWEEKRAERCRAYLRKNGLYQPPRLRNLAIRLEEPAPGLIRELGSADGTEALASLGEGLDGLEYTGWLRSLARSRAGRVEDGVSIATCFKAKGLEWPRVYLPNCDAGIYPSRKGDPEEERRLFYVALTRAKEALRLYADPHAPSPFLAEAGVEEGRAETERIRVLLAKGARLTPREALELASLAKRHALERYLALWGGEEARAAGVRLAAVVLAAGKRQLKRYGLSPADALQYRSSFPGSGLKAKDWVALRLGL